MLRHYRYVGDAQVREGVAGSAPGAVIRDLQALGDWLATERLHAESKDVLTATYVVDVDGWLRLAPRRSEHVACAGDAPVLSAGEITFALAEDPSLSEVVAVTNQSTGYCPPPESWPAVAAALDRPPIAHPGHFTRTFVFRRCPRCGERNVVKEDWYVCAICDADLPADWNFE